MRALKHYFLALVVIGLLACAPALAQTLTVCQCNIFDGGKWTNQDQSTVTYDTAKRFSQWVASINPAPSANPPISVVGMEELMSETDRTTIEGYLNQYTGASWQSVRIAQGVNGTSGVGFFWRPDLVETRSEWDLGSVTLEQIDNGYVVKFAGRLFRKMGADAALGIAAGKLLWDDAVLNGQIVTEETRRLEAVHLKNWIANGEPGSLGMSAYPGTTRVITTDLNTDTGTSTWNEMNVDYADPSTQHTASSFSPTWLMDIYGRRIDYVWWDYDAGVKRTGGFADGPHRSSHFGSDHRAVYATVNLHAVDLTAPSVGITTPAEGAVLSATTRIAAAATDASGVVQVQFFVDGSSVWTDTLAPYEFDWNALGAPEGAHTITAVATDASSNRLKGQSAPVTVWVSYSGNPPAIADVKKRPDGESVVLLGKVVTASFGSYFYIEEPAGFCGIKVTSTVAPAIGTKVNVSGKMNTLNGERQINATAVTTDGSLAVPDPVGLTNRALGGEGVGYIGAKKGVGLSNVGLLVTCWGRVTTIVGSFYLYIDDGSGIVDGYGYTGLRVDIYGLTGYTPPEVGSYVRVTGISCTSTISGKIQRRLKARCATDIGAAE
jgi:hypothetical protein